MPEEIEEEFMDRILGRVAEPADLDAELATGLVTESGTTALRHRFCVADHYDPIHNAHYNSRAAERRECAKTSKAAQQWEDYVDAHEKDFWPAILEEIKDIAPQVEWAKAVRSAWYNSDDLGKNRDVWMRIFADRARLAGITSPEEAQHFAKRRDPLTVYRGCHPDHIQGMSWSLDDGVAEGFARKLRPRGIVVQGRLKKEHVIVYLCPHGEEYEVIVSPEHVTDIHTVG